ncbi:hypothetical protein GCM10010498_66130 [Streptomyces cavourensis]|nr:hypothetical protein GCM10010498_66130 [Streptomyces cavourensis]
MTIGPEPMTRTDWISERLGTLALHQRNETIKQIRGIMRASGRFGVVLNAERRAVQELEPLDDLVV